MNVGCGMGEVGVGACVEIGKEFLGTVGESGALVGGRPGPRGQLQ